MKKTTYNRPLLVYVLFTYCYFISGYCYLSLPLTWITRSSNLTPAIFRGLDFTLALFRLEDIPLALRGLLLVYFIAIIPLLIFLGVAWFLKKIFGLDLNTGSWPFGAAVSIVIIISLFFLGPYYASS